MLKLFTGFLAITILSITNYSNALELNAKAYYIAHMDSDTTIMAKNSQQKIAPASLTKLMTVYLLFDAIKQGELNLQSELPVSKKAWKKPGSKMFVEVGKTVKVEDLIKGILVSSGNDACIVVAEYLGGTEKGFVEMMNEQAEELKMLSTTFANANGWPHATQLTTAEDMYKLSKAIIVGYPQFYADYFNITEFTYSNIRQQNRNGLLKQNLGIDGLKTGHVDEAGYHLIASSNRKGSRLISVLLGADGAHSREQETLTGLNYGQRKFKNYQLIEADYVVEKMAPVEAGSLNHVTLLAATNVNVFMEKKQRAKLKTKVEYNSPLQAPLTAGQVVGTVKVINPTTGDVYQSNIVVKQSVEKLGFFSQMLKMVAG